MVPFRQKEITLQCNYIKSNGQKCEAHALIGGKYCYRHSPEINVQEKKEASSRGGRNRRVKYEISLDPISLNKISDVVSLLEETINMVRSGDIDIRVANSLGYLSGYILKAIEGSEMEARIEKLELALIE